VGGQVVTTELGSEHRNTLEKILRHPTSGNIEWRQVRSLLEAVGTVTEEHDGKLKITLGNATETLYPPHGKDVGKDTIADLRKLLAKADLA
jgi:hypothetical protein